MKFFTYLGVGIFVIASIIFDAFIFTILWSWFIVSLFSVPQLTIPYAIGITIFINYLKEYKDPDKNKKMHELISTAIIRSVLVLGIGYIVHLFI